MKTKGYILMIAVVSLLFTACDSYLDIEPKGTADENKMFSDFEGYRDAMYGAYSSIAKSELYGKTLSYGFFDDLAQLYFNDSEAGSDRGNLYLKKVTKYEYKDQLIRPIIDGIWGKSYKSISYVNNVISHVNKVDLNSHPDFRLIKGEAYALRAFLHFDISRMFSENVSTNPKSRGIPYSKDFNLEIPKLSNLEITYGEIISDIEIAESLLENDTLLQPEIKSSSFGSERGIHLNKYAVWALKARVYLWKGDMKNAGIYAEKVIDSKRFQLYDKTELKKNIRYPSQKETIWALFNDKLYDNLWKKFLFENANNNAHQYVRSDLEEIYNVASFTAENTDVRYSSYFIEGVHGKLFKRLLNKPELDTQKGELVKDTLNGLSMIRLSEMYYIASEAYYETNFAKSKEYFNDLRKSRGLADIADNKIDSKSKYLNELFEDMRKEFWGEGQIFLESKRLNRDIEDKEGHIYNASAVIYVFPWPEDELEFGNNFKN